MQAPMIFALDASREFGARVAARFGGLAAHEERDFEDGEHKARPLVSVRNRDVYVVQSLYGDAALSVDGKLCRAAFFVGALVDAGAERVTLVAPYLCYARKDAKTQPRDPVTTRYVAALLEAVGVQRVVTLDVHNIAAFQNAFRCRTEHLDTAALFARHFAHTLAPGEELAVVSPDPGGIKRAERMRRFLARERGGDPAFAVMEKARGHGKLTGGRLIGDVSGRCAVVVDDLVGTGGTLAYAARACRAAGATRVLAAAAHGLFMGNAAEVLRQGDLEAVAVTDSVPPFRLPRELVEARLTILPVADLFAEAIGRLHAGGSLVELLED